MNTFCSFLCEALAASSSTCGPTITEIQTLLLFLLLSVSIIHRDLSAADPSDGDLTSSQAAAHSCVVPSSQVCLADSMADSTGVLVSCIANKLILEMTTRK